MLVGFNANSNVHASHNKWLFWHSGLLPTARYKPLTACSVLKCSFFLFSIALRRRSSNTRASNVSVLIAPLVVSHLCSKQMTHFLIEDATQNDLHRFFYNRCMGRLQLVRCCVCVRKIEKKFSCYSRLCVCNNHGALIANNSRLIVACLRIVPPHANFWHSLWWPRYKFVKRVRQVSIDGWPKIGQLAAHCTNVGCLCCV